MSRNIPCTVRAIEEALQIEFEIDGHQVIEKAGTRYVRLSNVTEEGAFVLGEINISRLAQDIERRLS